MYVCMYVWRLFSGVLEFGLVWFGFLDCVVLILLNKQPSGYGY